MRINVYSQELTREFELISVTAKDTGLTHHGLRFFLHSSDRLHATAEDDDRSAVTFWAADDGRKWDRLRLAELFEHAALYLRAGTTKSAK